MHSGMRVCLTSDWSIDLMLEIEQHWLEPFFEAVKATPEAVWPVDRNDDEDSEGGNESKSGGETDNDDMSID